MKRLLARRMHQARIMATFALSPAMLFQQISSLEWYDAMLRGWIDRHLDAPSLRVLDVGSATGYLSGYVQRAGHRPTGIDRSRSMIRGARRRHPGIEFVTADACSPPFADDVFDLVASASLVNIVPDPGLLLTQMTRVCRPGGTLTLLFPGTGFDDTALRQGRMLPGLSAFSEAALWTWHRSAPKMEASDAVDLLHGTGIVSDIEVRFHLHGMVASVSAKKRLG